jgi:hypothetical protein
MVDTKAAKTGCQGRMRERMKGLVNPGRKRYGLLFTLLLIMALVLVAPVAADTVTISPGQSIADAITSAGSGGTVILNPGVYYQSNINVGYAVTIKAATGHGPWDTIIDGSKSGDSILKDPSGYSLAIDNLTFQNGVTSSSGGAIYDHGGSVTVTSSTFTGCSASNFNSGAIYAGGSVTVTSSTFTGCSASGNGGAIFAGGSVTITSSTFTGCSASNFNGVNIAGIGGAIYAGGSVTVTSSTFTGCSASGGGYGGGNGGAIFAPSGTIQFCRFYHDTLGKAVYNGGGGSLDAPDNWWGTSSAPSSSDIGGGVTAPTWLVLGITASPATITTGGTSIISANLTYHTDGTTVSAVTGTTSAPNGTLVAFTVTGGTLSTATAYTGSGVAYTIFTPSSTGTSYITATVDGQSVTVPVTVTAATTTVNATSIVIDPNTPANIYAGIDGAGIYRSTNGGSSWINTGTQPTNLHTRALAINSSAPSTLYAGTYGGGVYTSTDSGVTWSACPAEPTNTNVLSLVTTSTGTLYAGTEAGVFVSTNNCASWSAINGGLP